MVSLPNNATNRTSMINGRPRVKNAPIGTRQNARFWALV